MTRLSATILSFLACISIQTTAQTGKELQRQLANIVSRNEAHTGVAVIINGEDTVTLNNNGNYPMMSVFKFHQALATARFMHDNNMPLSTTIHISKTELHENTYSPLRDKHPDGNIDMTVAELLTYTLQQSDNNACDILFSRIAGTEYTDRYIRSLGINDFAIAATEKQMHDSLPLCYANRTSPLEAAILLETFVTKPLFDESYQDFIKKTMIECKTGADRLAAPLAGTGAIIGHKTGSGDKNSKGQIIATNDIGFVFLPDGQRYSIAVFVKDSEEDAEDTARIIADISAAVYRYITDKGHLSNTLQSR